MIVRTGIAALFFWMIAATVPAQVYYWTDENGVKHFSNVKPAEEVDFEEKKEEKSGTGAAQQQPPPPNQPRNKAPQKPSKSGLQQKTPGAPSAQTKSPAEKPGSPEGDKEKTAESPIDVVAGHRLEIKKFPISQDQLIAEETARLRKLQSIFEQMGISREERIAAESERLMQAIRDLSTAPTPKFGSQDNKRRQVGYYKYRLQELTDSPDKYFQNIAAQGAAE